MILDQPLEDVYVMDMANERILVVDDDPQIVRLLRASLEQAGYAAVAPMLVSNWTVVIKLTLSIKLPLIKHEPSKPNGCM